MDLMKRMTNVARTNFAELPLSASFQSHNQFRLSLRCFNLAVARNVSFFSGWEEREFVGNQSQLRRNSGPPFYGISTSEGLVAGYCSPHIITELVEQWRLLADLGMLGPSSELSSRLSVLSSNLWYAELSERILDFEKENEIASFGEDDALSSILCFSRLSILLMKRETKLVDNEQLLHNALSVIVPLTQFSLNENIWDARIGSEATSRSPEEWRRLVAAGENRDHLRPSERPGYVKTSMKQSDHSRDNVIDWFLGENSNEPMRNLVTAWKGRSAEVWKQIVSSRSQTEKAACEAMDSLHCALLRLRQSFTEEAVSRASILVASAMIEISMYPECSNGLLCLQQAALFAGHGSKRGNNDDFFKQKLPEKENCSPHEALIILGRADCLSQIHFCQEAAFLCGFVASVCAMHRKEDSLFSDQWTLVSITAYNTSVMIRDNALKLIQLGQDQKRFNFDLWDITIKSELMRGREDGLSWSEANFTQRSSQSQSERLQDSYAQRAATAETEKNIESDLMLGREDNLFMSEANFTQESILPGSEPPESPFSRSAIIGEAGSDYGNGVEVVEL